MNSSCNHVRKQLQGVIVCTLCGSILFGSLASKLIEAVKEEPHTHQESTRMEVSNRDQVVAARSSGDTIHLNLYETIRVSEAVQVRVGGGTEAPASGDSRPC